MMTLSSLQTIENSILNLSTDEQQLLFQWMNENLQKNINQISDLDDEIPPTLEEINQARRIINSAIISAINTPDGNYDNVWNEFEQARSRILDKLSKSSSNID